VVSILLAMLGIVVLAGLVVVYVAYPHRGHDVPNAPWLGDAMRRAVRNLPTLHNQRLADRAVPVAARVGERRRVHQPR
jgi:hypothetical protein